MDKKLFKLECSVLKDNFCTEDYEKRMDIVNEFIANMKLYSLDELIQRYVILNQIKFRNKFYRIEFYVTILKNIFFIICERAKIDNNKKLTYYFLNKELELIQEIQTL